MAIDKTNIHSSIKERLFGIILYASAVLTGILLITEIYLNSVSTSIATLLISILLFELLVWGIWKTRSVSMASNLFILGLSIMIPTVSFYSGTVTSGSLSFQLLIVLVSGLVADSFITYFVVILFSVSNFLLYAKPDWLSFPEPIFLSNMIIDYISHIATLYLIGFLVILFTQMLNRLIREIEKSEQRYRSLFDKTSDIVFSIGMDYSIDDVNDTGVDILGFTKEEMVGMPFAELAKRSNADEIKERFRAALRQGTLAPERLGFASKQGDTLVLDSNLSVVLGSNGRPSHFQSIARDITRKVREEQKMKSTLAEMTVRARTDDLTGLLNREAIMQQANAEWERHQRSDNDLSLLLIDLDKLKKINDQYGHISGDRAISIVADALHSSKRQYDVAGRYGGDEFIVILPETNFDEAAIVAERIREKTEGQRIRLEDKAIRVSASIGVASTSQFEDQQLNLKRLIREADAALYKEKGREIS